MTTLTRAVRPLPLLLMGLMAAVLMFLLSLATTTDSTTGYVLWTQAPGKPARSTSVHSDLARCEAARRFYLEGNPTHQAWCEAGNADALP